MVGLSQGLSSSCTAPVLDLHTQVRGIATDVAGVEFQIFSLVSPTAAPAQVVPVTAGERQVVDVETDCPAGDRLSIGRYVARWAVPSDQAPGRYRIVWFVRETLTSPEQTFSEDFEVLPAAEAATVDDVYALVSDLRADGVLTSQASDRRLIALIEEQSRLIDQLTGLFFTPREMRITLDGIGTQTLFLDQPIISLASAKLDETTVELSSLNVYNRHLSQRLLRPDDRRAPMVRRKDECSRWTRGSQNVELSGVFGYTDPTPATLTHGELPPQINLACRMLVVRELELLNSQDRVASRRLHEIKSETTRDQSVTYGDRRTGTSVPTYGSTGDPEIDAILARFRAPLRMAMV